MVYKKACSTFVLSFFLLYSCDINSQINKQVDESIKISEKNINYKITGKTALSDFTSSFSIKADTNYATMATVSVIYPSDYHDASLREATVATGLTDINGVFSIDPQFIPETNQVMILESSKRKGEGYSSISLRTHIKWNGSNWESISGNDILINKQTTAIALVSSLEPNILSSSDSINRVSFSNSTAGTVSYNSQFTSQIYTRYLGNVSSRLNSLVDPVRFYNNNDFFSGQDRAKLSSVKANMHTLQTIAETYAVDWSGIYASGIEVLEQEARSKGYWKNLINPFNSSNSSLKVISDSDYINAKTTMQYKGQDIGDLTFFAGVVTYQPVYSQPNNPDSITSYVIYGLDSLGEYINDRGETPFFLSNN